MSKTALVTGSAGFVGCHLVPKLVEAGYRVTGWDPKHPNVLGTPGDADLIGSRWTSSLTTYDVVVHLAANILDVDARARAGVGIYDDLLLDLEMCKWIERNPPREAFIAMSSCATDYPGDCYGWIKLTLEKFCERLHKQRVPVVILRPYSGYGGDQALSYPFPAILERAKEKQNPLTVWSSAETVRDWVHIEDLCNAIIHGVHNFPRGVPIQIGTGIPTKFGDLARTMADAVGYEPEIKADQSKINSSAYRVADTSLAEQHGWKATISLEEGIRRAL